MSTNNNWDGFDFSFWAGLGIGFILGIPASYYGARLFDWYKRRKRGTKPYCDVSITGDLISIEAQMPNTAATHTAVGKIEKSFITENS